jgi:DNA polymerase-1
MFSLILAVKGGNSYYFNFHDYKDNSPVINRRVLFDLKHLFTSPNILWVMANAKFDMHKKHQDDVKLNGRVYDVLLMARIQYNKHMSYSLDACLKRIGLAKDDKVSLWIKDNKAYSMVEVPGKKTKEKNLHYDRVPFDIIVPYGFSDAEDTLKLFEHQMEYFNREENSEQLTLVDSNIQLTTTVFEMEKRGILINTEYCEQMSETLAIDLKVIESRIETITGKQYKGGPKWLVEVLAEQGIEVTFSDKGNAELDHDVLSKIDNAVAHLVLELREKEKQLGFYQNLLRFQVDGVIHTNFRINGTDTMRFSSGDPNLQNIPACEKGVEATVRHAFRPRPGYYFLSVDYSSMEFRLCVDIAGETSMIDAINNGLDPHQQVADMMGADRKAAKTLNFLSLYGGGAQRLADQLGCDLSRAKVLKAQYHSALPNVNRLHQDVQGVARSRGYVRNKYGMRYYLDDDSRAYAMVNHLIQGTGACIIRSAMNKLAFFLEGTRSAMLLQIHDELVCEIHETELHLIPEIIRIMEQEYTPINGMPMKCDAALSKISWNENTFTNWRDHVAQ